MARAEAGQIVVDDLGCLAFSAVERGVEPYEGLESADRVRILGKGVVLASEDLAQGVLDDRLSSQPEVEGGAQRCT